LKATQMWAGQFVGLMCSHERNVWLLDPSDPAYTHTKVSKWNHVINNNYYCNALLAGYTTKDNTTTTTATKQRTEISWWLPNRMSTVCSTILWTHDNDMMKSSKWMSASFQWVRRN